MVRTSAKRTVGDRIPFTSQDDVGTALSRNVAAAFLDTSGTLTVLYDAATGDGARTFMPSAAGL